MNRTGIKRILKSGWLNFTRNTFVSLSAVLVMVVMLLIISGVLLTDRLLTETLSSIQDKVDVNVYFNPNVEESVVLSLEEQLNTLPEVERVEYISREDAISQFRERHQNNQSTLEALDELGENPLGATLTIKAKNPSQYESIAEFLESYQSVNLSANNIDKINYFDNKQAIETLNNIIDGSKTFGFIISIIFVFISIIITLNTLRLAIYISKNEIHVMNLVGATEGYIRGPFIVTGAIYGIVATIIVMVLLIPISLWMTSVIQDFFIDVNFMDYYIQDLPRLILWLLVSGVVTGAVASTLAVRKYVNSKRRG